MSEQETFLVVSEDGKVLARTSAPHDLLPFNRAVKIAQDILAQSGGKLLFIDDDAGRRWGRLEQIAPWCWSYCPTENREKE